MTQKGGERGDMDTEINPGSIHSASRVQAQLPIIHQFYYCFFLKFYLALPRARKTRHMYKTT